MSLARVFSELEDMLCPYEEAMVDGMSKEGRDPFRILIATLLSLRTKDEVTGAASKRLFQKAKNPRELARMDESIISELIYPVGFYKTKAKTLKTVAQTLVAEYEGRVPDSMDELLALKGVGRKTANLVLSAGFGKDAICVDTHVHRISNRWGYVSTKDAKETEHALRKKLPKKYWRRINGLLVTFGQNICKPISPFCSLCSLSSWWCKQLGVERRR